MEPESDSEASPMCSLSEDECHVKKEERPLPTAFCDMRVSYLRLYSYCSHYKTFLFIGVRKTGMFM
jgi:hypothetical protein